MTYIDLQDGLGPSTDEVVRMHAVMEAENELARIIAQAAHTAWCSNDAEAYSAIDNHCVEVFANGERDRPGKDAHA